MRILLLFLISILSVGAQSLGQLQKRPDGIWLVYSNTASHWSLQKSTNLYEWYPLIEGQTSFPSVEVRLESGFEMVFYRLATLP